MKRTRWMSLPLAAAFSLVCCALVARAAIAQPVPSAPAQPGTFGESLTVQEVLLDVLVTDRAGNPVLGLGPDDFVIEENGRPIAATSATFASHRRFVGSAAEAARAGAVITGSPLDARHFVILIHDQRAANAEAPGLLARQLDAGRRLHEWIQTGLEATDWVAVASWDQKLRVLSDFTRDRDVAAQAVDDAVTGKDRGLEWPSRGAAETRDDRPSLLASLPSGNALRDRTTTIYDGIAEIAEASGAVRGRKNLLLLTTGFGRVDSFGQYTPDRSHYDPMQRALNANNVAVYAVDFTPPGTEHVMAGGMNQLAAETGGRYLFNFTSFSTAFGEVAKENGGYYLLSYSRPAEAGASGYQRVTVRVKNPEFRVKSREGYRYGARLPN